MKKHGTVEGFEVIAKSILELDAEMTIYDHSNDDNDDERLCSALVVGDMGQTKARLRRKKKKNRGPRKRMAPCREEGR